MSAFSARHELKDGQPGISKPIQASTEDVSVLFGGGGTIIAAANTNGTSPRSLASIHDGAGIGPFGRS
jgi:hypothetical protein